MSSNSSVRDQDVINKGRRNKLPTDEVQVPLTERIVTKLVKKLEDLDEGQRSVEIWETGNMRRGEWLMRQEKLWHEYDEFLDPIYEAPQEWSSTLHLPVTYTVGRTVHARMMAALLELEPPFTVKARTAANEGRVDLVTQVMQYALKYWANDRNGVEEELDAWVWRWVMGGVGILKSRWHRKYTRFVDVVQREEMQSAISQDPETGEEFVTQQPALVDVEEEVTKMLFDGPMLENREPEDILIVGGKGDPQTADEVIEIDYLTAGELWSLVDQGVFREKAVEKAISYGESHMGSESNIGNIKLTRAEQSGVSDPDSTVDHARYAVLERYARIDVDGSGIPSDIILWVHKESREILRATYLHRVMPTGLRPYFKIDFHKRHGQDYGVGLAELMYTLTKELDAIHNMKVDFGLLSSMPWGFYRPTNSTSEERMPLEPGVLIPLDNPQSDVFFPVLGNRSAFSQGEEQFLLSQIARLTSIDDLNLGVIGGQGVARTATGARALVGESNSNLNVFLRRMNRGWSKALKYLFHMIQLRVKPGQAFRVTGDDGSTYFREIKSPEELAGMFDFELEANSANSNKQVQDAVAMEVYQLTSNPIDLQLGLVSPLERYEALKMVLQAKGIKDIGRFIRKPAQVERAFTPEELTNRILRGVDERLTPNQDLEGFIAYVTEVFNADELLGQFNEEQTIRLARKLKEAQQMVQALKQQQAQAANLAQQQTNSAQGSNPGAAVPFNAPTGGTLGEY